MDPLSAVVATFQISSQCIQVTSALAKYVRDVNSVDVRVQAFSEDVEQLTVTYKGLEACRGSHSVREAARSADASTTRLWSQLATTLRDCGNTLSAISQIIVTINKPLSGLARFQKQKIFKAMVMQMKEQLHGGELERHQKKIQMFNNSIALAMHMITIAEQLNQRRLGEEHQRRLDKRLTSMQRTLDLLHGKIANLRLTQGNENVICEHMETFANGAVRFLDNASSIAGTIRDTTTVQADNPLTGRDIELIDAWISPAIGNSDTICNDIKATTSSASPATPPTPAAGYSIDSSDAEDLALGEVRTYFDNGQADFAKDEFVAAEENFIEALEVLRNHDFGSQLAFQSADVILMLSDCYVKQDKLDEAIQLLVPLTEDDTISDGTAIPTDSTSSPLDRHKSKPDRGCVLAAHHTLGDIYLKKQDREKSEAHSLYAFNGRRTFLGKTHEKTIESVQLVVNMYTARGRTAKARYFSTHLNPSVEGNRRLSDQGRRVSTQNNQVLTPVSEAFATTRPTSMTQATQPNTKIPRDTSANDLTSTESGCSDSNQASVFDDVSTVTSFTQASSRRLSSQTVRQYLKPRFDAIKTDAATSDKKACNAVEHLLKGYDPTSKILLLRWRDIKANIKKQGTRKGLAATGSGYAPVHFFCEVGKEAITEMELLIEDGVDLMAIRYRAGYNDEPMTPLQMAIENNHQNIAVIIVDSLQRSTTSISQVMALRDPEGLSPLLTACRMGQTETVARLLRWGAAFFASFPHNWYGNSLLHDACSRCDVTMVGLLLSNDTDLREIGSIDQQDPSGKTSLMYAVISKNIHEQAKQNQKLVGRYQCVKLLLRHAGEGVKDLCASVDSEGMTAFAYAKKEGDHNLLELFERSGCGDKGTDVAP